MCWRLIGCCDRRLIEVATRAKFNSTENTINHHYLKSAVARTALALRVQLLLMLFLCRCACALLLLLLVQAAAQHSKLALGQRAEDKADQLTLQLLATGHCTAQQQEQKSREHMLVLQQM